MDKEHIKNSQKFEHNCELSAFPQGIRIFCFVLEEGEELFFQVPRWLFFLIFLHITNSLGEGNKKAYFKH